MTPDDGVLTFSPGSTAILCFIVQSVDDQISEDLENFIFALLSEDPAITGVNPSGVQISVVDNDGKVS